MVLVGYPLCTLHPRKKPAVLIILQRLLPVATCQYRNNALSPVTISNAKGFLWCSLYYQRNTKGTPTEHQRNTKGTPKEHQRNTKGIPKEYHRNSMEFDRISWNPSSYPYLIEFGAASHFFANFSKEIVPFRAWPVSAKRWLILATHGTMGGQYQPTLGWDWPRPKWNDFLWKVCEEMRSRSEFDKVGVRGRISRNSIEFHWIPMVFLWYSFGIPLVFLWCSFGVPLVFRWCSFGVPLVIQGTPKESLGVWDGHGR